MNGQPRETWYPKFRQFVGAGRGDVHYNLPEEGIDECPVSFITSESQALVELFSTSKIIQKQNGLGMMGDPADWPAWLLDAATVIEACDRKQQDEFEDELDRQRSRT